MKNIQMRKTSTYGEKYDEMTGNFFRVLVFTGLQYRERVNTLEDGLEDPIWSEWYGVEEAEE